MAEPPVREVFLRPGEFSFGEGRLRIATLLGSCISIVLWHPQRLLGGMCHYVLPSRGHAGTALDGRYADEAMLLFMRALHHCRTQPREYRVSIYGGGAMTEHCAAGVGARNIAAAYRELEAHGFRLAGEHVGKAGYRKIEFEVWSGRVQHVYVSYAEGASSGE